MRIASFPVSASNSFTSTSSLQNTLDPFTMESTSSTVEAPQPVFFRGKKRKTYRQRPGTQAEAEAEAEDKASTAPTDAALDAPNASVTTTTIARTLTPDRIAASADEEQEEALSISEALRLRNARKSRLRGVTFGVDNGTQSEGLDGGDDELSQMIREEEKKAIEQSITVANKRFAPQTGLSGEIVNKHM